MSLFSKAMECSVCLEPCGNNVILCKNGHGACNDCATRLRRSCHMCRGRLLPTFLPNRPLDGVVASFQALEHERCAVEARLETERVARSQVEYDFAQFKSKYEGLMQAVERQTPGNNGSNKRPRSGAGESSSAALCSELIGRTMEIRGLVRSTHHNGKRGTVHGPYENIDGGLVVQLEDGRQVAMSRDAIERCIEVLE